MRKLFLLCITAVFTSSCGIFTTSSDPATEGVLIGNLYWAKGNLVADGDNGCKIGAPTDGGLYFQWGELVGWSGGATGDGVSVGEPTLSQRVTPRGYSGSTSWDSDYEGTGNYDADTPSVGTGDPCRYYLGGKWRTPTSAEYKLLFDNVDGATAWVDVKSWSWSESSASAYNSQNLRFPASGARYYSNGSFNGVGSGGCCWSSSVSGSGNGYYPFFASSGVISQNDSYRSYGFPVRCVSPS